MASAALAGLMLRGPRMLNEAEASAQQRPPLPRTPPLETIVARRTASEPAASVAAPVAVADLSIGVSTPRATATCQARARRHRCSLDWGTSHDRSLSRPACSFYRI